MITLVQWVWQGLALVAIVSLCLSRARRVSASTRYRLWWATLALVVALPFLRVLDLPGVGAVLGVAGPVELATAQGSSLPPEISSWAAWLQFLAVGSWILWSATRFYAAIAHLDAAKRTCRPFPIARERALSRWKGARNRGRRATLVVSEHVRAAAVLGLGYPRIAIAPSLVSSLSDDELDQLVLHEYAHVQRRDDQASAVQLFVKILIGWHPAAWWIDRSLRIEREVACDDWVLATTGAPRTYARCLTHIADLAVGSESSLMPAATCQRQLTTRVVRLLDGRRNTSIHSSRPALAAAATALAVLSIGLTGSHTTAITLPAVARAGFAPTVQTPELTITRLWQELSEPTARRTARLTSDIDAPLASRDEQQDTVRADAVQALTTVPVALSSADLVNASLESAPESHIVATNDSAKVASPHAAPVPSSATPETASAENSAVSTDADESGSWVETTGRALADAGKTTGQSIAVAGRHAGSAVADAGVAAFRGTQKSAVKAGRLFSRLGRTLARPF